MSAKKKESRVGTPDYELLLVPKWIVDAARWEGLAGESSPTIRISIGDLHALTPESWAKLFDCLHDEILTQPAFHEKGL